MPRPKDPATATRARPQSAPPWKQTRIIAKANHPSTTPSDIHQANTGDEGKPPYEHTLRITAVGSSFVSRTRNACYSHSREHVINLSEPYASAYLSEGCGQERAIPALSNITVRAGRNPESIDTAHPSTTQSRGSVRSIETDRRTGGRGSDPLPAWLGTSAPPKPTTAIRSASLTSTRAACVPQPLSSVQREQPAKHEQNSQRSCQSSPNFDEYLNKVLLPQIVASVKETTLRRRLAP